MARSIREAGHLPHNREGGQPPDPQELPRQRAGITPQMHGRYPDYDVLANADHWDEVTREQVVARASTTPPVRFFSGEEAECLRVFCDVVLAQDAEPRVPVLEMVDAKLHDGKLDGYQYAFMPDDRETWRRVARHLRAEGLVTADGEQRQKIIGRFAQGELGWDDLDVATAWSVVMRGVLSEFYSHPWAWNEIGFGGPAYPRGYMRLHAGPTGREPHEAREAFDVDPVETEPSSGPG